MLRITLRRWVLSGTMVALSVAPVAAWAAGYSSTTSTMSDKAKSTADTAKTEVTDSWITLKTKMALLADERVSANDVHVTTQKGVITLNGTVPSADAKQAAESEALKTTGARRVVNRLAVARTADQKMAKREDKQITDDVEGRLKNDGALQTSKIDVRVDNGIVTLTGDAPSLQASVHASEVAHKVPGVRAVQNDISVKGESTQG